MKGNKDFRSKIRENLR